MNDSCAKAFIVAWPKFRLCVVFLIISNKKWMTIDPSPSSLEFRVFVLFGLRQPVERSCLSHTGSLNLSNWINFSSQHHDTNARIPIISDNLVIRS